MRLTTRSGDAAHPGAAGVPRIAAAAATVAALAVIFQLDRATGSAPVQHLYYLPIVVAAVFFGRTGGLLVALAAVVLYHSTNPQLLTFKYEHWDLLQIGV